MSKTVTRKLAGSSGTKRDVASVRRLVRGRSAQILRIGLGQINNTIVDFRSTLRKIQEVAERADSQGCQAVAFPELSLIGYPPKDLLKRKSVLAEQDRIQKELMRTTRGITVITGGAKRNLEGRGKPLFNCALVLADGQLQSQHEKVLLPTYDVFEEGFYFKPGGRVKPARILGQRVGLTNCEDIWRQRGFAEAALYDRDPVAELVSLRVQWFLNISASPFHLGKDETRNRLLRSIATRYKRPILYVNAVGGQDNLLFDGGSTVVDAQGRICAQSPQFVEDLLIVDMEKSSRGFAISGPIAPTKSRTDQAYQALVMGVGDYVRKTGFRQGLIGLSGDIDSALTAAIAVEALGMENVWGVALPGPFSSKQSLTDARELAKNLGIRFDIASIKEVFGASRRTLKPLLGNRAFDETEENLQTHLRGNFLMALSRQFGHLLLTSGNKSELAVGHSTFYGDMCGGLSVLGDVPKTLVYDIARAINRRRKVIPQRSMDNSPSSDKDSLPPYRHLDAIIENYIDLEKDVDEVVASLARRRISRKMIEQVIARIDGNEIKRRQAALCLQITSRAFGTGRRYPIAQRFTRLL